MYIWLCWRSVGAGNATTRNTRGLTRSVIALIVPPLPAVSRPSNTMQTFRPFATTHCCSLTSSTCRRASSSSYSFRRMRSAVAVARLSATLLVLHGLAHDLVVELDHLCAEGVEFRMARYEL